RLGQQAEVQVTWLRDTYPAADAARLARMATAWSVRQARTQGAVAGLLGPLAVFAGTAALLRTQARLVLDIAAAYGRDPTDRERAAELLVLLRVHPDLAAAREALAAAREAADNGPGAGSNGNQPPQVTVPLVRVAGRALVRTAAARQAARIVPGAGAALTAILDGRSTELLAARATEFYRG
ncbi:MAG TPA: EcsC family protein, partial [Planosporangium sp.]|nr:EcsC family protein [Planosporangium sp.]